MHEAECGAPSACHIETPATPPSRGRGVLCLSILLMLAGLAPRLAHFFSGRALWLDETQLAASLYERGFLGLLRPLEFSQVAPPLYLWSQKLAMLFLGPTVYAVRLPSLIGSIAHIACFYLIARRFLKPYALLSALFFLVVSQHLIYYAAECKPYSTDACAAFFFLWLILWWERGALQLWRSALLVLMAMVLVSYSLPMVFVVGGVGGVALLHAGLNRDRMRLLHLLAICGGAAGLFLLIYFFLWRAVEADEHTVTYMQHYWRHGFMPFPPQNLFQLRWFRERAFLFFAMPGGFTLTGLALFVWLAGLVSLAWRSPKFIAMLLAPLLLVLLASGVKAYPFHGRMTLFLAPMIFLLMGEGVAVLTQHRSRNYALIAVLLIALLGAQPTVRALRMSIAPTPHHELDRALEHVDDQYAEGDILYLRHIDFVAYCFMQERYAFSPKRVLTESRENRRGEAFEAYFETCLPKLREAETVWFALAYDHDAMIDPFIEYLNQFGQGQRTFVGRGACVYRYAFNKTGQ